jgi:hypothetical protein
MSDKKLRAVESETVSYEIELEQVIRDLKGKAQKMEPGTPEERDYTIRDALIAFLSSPLKTKNPSETQLLYQTGLQIGDEKVSKVTLSSKRFETLKRHIKENKTQDGGPVYLLPFIHAQVMSALGIMTSEDDE